MRLKGARHEYQGHPFSPCHSGNSKVVRSPYHRHLPLRAHGKEGEPAVHLHTAFPPSYCNQAQAGPPHQAPTRISGTFRYADLGAPGQSRGSSRLRDSWAVVLGHASLLTPNACFSACSVHQRGHCRTQHKGPPPVLCFLCTQHPSLSLPNLRSRVRNWVTGAERATLPAQPDRVLALPRRPSASEWC